MTTPYLSAFLKPSARNLESLKAAWARMLELAYTPRKVKEQGGCTRTRCASAHDGFSGSEHRWALTCQLCGADVDVYYSHMRERGGANPKPPARHKGCQFGGKRNAAARAARYSELGIPLPAWDTEAVEAAKEAAAPDADEAAQAASSAESIRTATAEERAAKRTAAPAPQPRPPRTHEASTARNSGSEQSAAEQDGISLLRELLSFD